METSANVVGFNFARADLSDPSIGLPNEAPPSLAADPGERPSPIVTDRLVLERSRRCRDGTLGA